jgi:hypothetical protein
MSGELAVCAGTISPWNVHRINGLYDCQRSHAPVLGHPAAPRFYAEAAALGLSQVDLLACTRTALWAAFTAPERRKALLAELAGWSEPATVT